MTEPLTPEHAPTRRQVLLTGGVVVAAAAVTAACGSSSGAASTSGGASTPAESPAATSATASSGGGGGTSLATADVPVGGGTILADQKVVVTQPAAGEFKAFTAVCTHQGCAVASVANGVITCPCHGSTFSITDGSVKGGPAPAPLAAVPVTVSGTTLTIG